MYLYNADENNEHVFIEISEKTFGIFIFYDEKFSSYGLYCGCGDWTGLWCGA